ncbi:MAG: dihydroneopterin aldolase, partial [Muribaculaceae bacterium]|nr:dihydroneopterin aldolase [Muribaculaceae bacterium]
MVTTIHLKMQVRGFHGVDEQERRVGNDFAVSLSLQYPFDKAMASDNLDDT